MPSNKGRGRGRARREVVGHRLVDVTLKEEMPAGGADGGPDSGEVQGSALKTRLWARKDSGMGKGMEKLQSEGIAAGARAVLAPVLEEPLQDVEMQRCANARDLPRSPDTDIQQSS